MATINLGRVKGDPFTYDDFTPEQLAGLKGESFKFEDFSEEQLDSITPKIEVGTVTTLEAGSQATVTPTVNGNTTTFDFGIPKGEDFDLEKVDTRTDLMSVSEPGKLADALAIKEALDYYNVGRNNGASYASLEAFVEATATDTTMPHVGRFKDAGGFITGSVTWYRYIIVYQNPYITGGASSVRGNGIIWDDSGKMRNIFISGNKDTRLNIEYELVNKPTITTQADLMANTVSGLFPDALAVKDSINWITSKVNYDGFVIMGEISGTKVSKCFQEMGITQDNTIDEVASIIGVYGNHYTKQCLIFTNSNSSNFSNSLPVRSGSFINMYLQGNNSAGRHYIELYDYRTGDTYKKYVMDGVASEWIPDSDVRTIESIESSTVTITLNDVAKNAGLTPSDFSFSGNIEVVHAGGLNHSISFGITCEKAIPEGALIELAFSNVNFQKLLSSWGMHPTAKAYAELKNDSKTIRCLYDKTINAGFLFWPVITYTSISRLRTVKL